MDIYYIVHHKSIYKVAAEFILLLNKWFMKHFICC